MRKKLRALENEKFNLERKLAKIEKENPKCEAWKYFINPEVDEEIEKIIADLRDAIFKMKDVLEFEKKHGLGKTIKNGKQLPNQKAKNECRKIAKKLLIKYPDMPICQMETHPEIMEVSKEWLDSTRHRWICDLFPPHLRKPGRKRKIKIK